MKECLWASISQINGSLFFWGFNFIKLWLNSFSKWKAPSTKTINDYIGLHMIRDSNDFITQDLYRHCYYQWHFCCRNLEIESLLVIIRWALFGWVQWNKYCCFKLHVLSLLSFFFEYFLWINKKQKTKQKK